MAEERKQAEVRPAEEAADTPPGAAAAGKAAGPEGDDALVEQAGGYEKASSGHEPEHSGITDPEEAARRMQEG
jgi:hypothetical protein